MYNHRLLATVFSILLSVQFLTAQLQIGARGGVSLGRLSDNSENLFSRDFSSTSGFDIGAFVEVPITSLFSFQGEILFTDRGGERTGVQPIVPEALGESLAGAGLSLDILNSIITGAGGTAISNTNPLFGEFDNVSDLNYLEVPLLAKVGWGDQWRFYAVGGPYVSFLLSSEQVTGGSSGIFLDPTGAQRLQVPNPFFNPIDPTFGPPVVDLPDQSFEAVTDTSDDLNSFNIGAQFGVGLNRKLGAKHSVLFDARSSVSFRSLQVDEDFGNSNVGGVVFSLGYAFSLG